MLIVRVTENIRAVQSSYYSSCPCLDLPSRRTIGEHPPPFVRKTGHLNLMDHNICLFHPRLMWKRDLVYKSASSVSELELLRHPVAKVNPEAIKTHLYI
jgi:hypothetical protein